MTDPEIENAKFLYATGEQSRAITAVNALVGSDLTPLTPELKAKIMIMSSSFTAETRMQSPKRIVQDYFSHSFITDVASTCPSVFAKAMYKLARFPFK